MYFAAIPVGTALGYVGGAALSKAAGWEWCFFVEAAAMAPIALVFLALPPGTFSLDPAAGEEVAPISFGEEIALILRRPVFVLVTCGYAAYAACVMGFSTFGPAFAIGLGFFDDAVSASLTFGAVVSLSGLVGTVLGGSLLDVGVGAAAARCRARPSRRSRRSPSTTTTTAWPTPAAPPPPAADERRALLGAAAADGRARSGFRAERAAEPPAGVKLVVCCEQVWWLNLAGLGLTTAGALCAKSKYTFMAMIGFGTLPLFACTAGMNLAIMESVPAANRPFAVALGTLLMHVLGDVPAAPAVGALKDAWAPSCTPSDDGGIPDDATDECAAERDALRRVILACCVWLVWALIGFGGAWFDRRARHLRARRAVRALRVRPRRVELRPSAARG